MRNLFKAIAFTYLAFFIASATFTFFNPSSVWVFYFDVVNFIVGLPWSLLLILLGLHLITVAQIGWLGSLINIIILTYLFRLEKETKHIFAPLTPEMRNKKLTLLFWVNLAISVLASLLMAYSIPMESYAGGEFCPQTAITLSNVLTDALQAVPFFLFQLVLLATPIYLLRRSLVGSAIVALPVNLLALAGCASHLNVALHYQCTYTEIVDYMVPMIFADFIPALFLVIVLSGALIHRIIKYLYLCASRLRQERARDR